MRVTGCGQCVASSSTKQPAASFWSMNLWTRLVDSISAKLAFYPPCPATYELKQDPGGRLLMHPSKRWRSFPLDVFRLQTKRGKTVASNIVGVYIPYKDGSGPVLIYSHGNAVDLGIMVPFYRELSEILKCNVMSYDYTGYGCSSGSPTVSNTILDIEAAYNYALSHYNKQPHEVVLYGQSVGSGPTVNLASRTPDLGGVILHSPLLSGFRVLHPDLKNWPTWLDIYPNHRLMPLVKCPVLVMHGTEDEVVDFSHGKRLAELASNSTGLWADGYNHQNLEQCPSYIPELLSFFETHLRNTRDG